MFSGPITSVFSAMHSDENPFPHQCQKSLRVWNFALLWVIFKWSHGSEGVKQPKHPIKMAAETLLLPTEATIGGKTITGTHRRRPTYHWKPHIIIRASRIISNTNGEDEKRKSRIRRGHRSWTSATIAPNRMNLNCCHAVSNQFRSFDVTHFALSVKQRVFPDLKINTSQ